MIPKSIFCARALTIVLALLVVASSTDASTPVAVWDGSSASHNFSKLTRINGNLAYTMNINKENATVNAENSCITVGNEDAQPTVTITASAAGALGSTTVSGFTVIARVAKAGAIDGGGNRSVLNYYNSSYEAGAALAHYGQASGTPGKTFPLVGNNAYYDLTEAGTLGAGDEMQTIALSYGAESQGGIAFYVDGNEVYHNAAIATAFSPEGISIGGMANENSNKLYASRGMKIYAVAIFTNRLTTAEAEAYTSSGGFPASNFPAAISVSSINRQSEGGSTMTVSLDAGDVVYGDTAFDASTVNFTCNGSFTLWTPAGNTATFDFSGVTGKPILAYGSIPSVSGDVFTATTVPTWVTNSASWNGVIGLTGAAITGPNFNNYGNSNSAIMLSGVSGWINTGSEYTVPVILENGSYDFALRLTNGNSPLSDNVNRCSVFSKISGTGDLVDDLRNQSGNAQYAWPVIKVYDASEFSGSVILSQATLLVCDSSTAYSPSLYEMFTGNRGTLRIESGKSIGLAAGKVWSVAHVLNNGTLTGAGFISTSTAELPDGTYNSDGWTGTVAISGVDSATPLNLQDYGNVNSTVQLTAIGGTAAYLPSGNVTAGKLVLVSNDVAAITFALNNGYSDGNTIFTELSGNGAFSQSNGNIYQGITINAMTNYTGTLSLNHMNVTFGTQRRSGYGCGGKLYIDPEAILSVPAGFALWSPNGLEFNGPVNFTTDELPLPQTLVLFRNVGTGVTLGPNMRIKINGVDVDEKGYRVKVVGTDLVLKRKSMAISYR